MATPDANIKRVADKAHNAVDKAAEVAETVELKAKETSQQVKATTSETVDTVKVASENAQDKVMDYVNKHPMKSIGIAFGAGIIASAILRK